MSSTTALKSTVSWTDRTLRHGTVTETTSGGRTPHDDSRWFRNEGCLLFERARARVVRFGVSPRWLALGTLGSVVVTTGARCSAPPASCRAPCIATRTTTVCATPARAVSAGIVVTGGGTSALTNAERRLVDRPAPAACALRVVTGWYRSQCNAAVVRRRSRAPGRTSPSRTR